MFGCFPTSFELKLLGGSDLNLHWATTSSCSRRCISQLLVPGILFCLRESKREALALVAVKREAAFCGVDVEDGRWQTLSSHGAARRLWLGRCGLGIPCPPTAAISLEVPGTVRDVEADLPPTRRRSPTHPRTDGFHERFHGQSLLSNIAPERASGRLSGASLPRGQQSTRSPWDRCTRLGYIGPSGADERSKSRRKVNMSTAQPLRQVRWKGLGRLQRGGAYKGPRIWRSFNSRRGFFLTR